MTRAIDHFEEKLYKLADMMKTKSGRELGQARKKVLEDFATEFGNEAELSFMLK